ARALAALPQLLGYAAPLLKEGGRCVFLKGQMAEEELAAAKENWSFSFEKQQTISGGDGVVLVLKDIAQK
ncbi:MAG: 16S rRNA (guanine(527)-N(7))-methyltransferase RsmG, partial [Alphaproteobacteria bacterium]